MYVYIHTYICIYVYIHIYIHVYVYIHTYIHRKAAAHFVWLSVFVCVCVSCPMTAAASSLYAYTYMYRYVYVYIHTYIRRKAAAHLAAAPSLNMYAYIHTKKTLPAVAVARKPGDTPIEKQKTNRGKRKKKEKTVPAVAVASKPGDTNPHDRTLLQAFVQPDA